MPEKDDKKPAGTADAGKADDKKGKKGKGEEKKATPPPPPPPTPVEMLNRHLSDLEKYTESRDARYLSRVMRYTNFLRAHLPTADLRSAVETFVLDAGRKAALLALFDRAAAVRKEPAPLPAAAAPAAASATAPAAAAAGDKKDASDKKEATGKDGKEAADKKDAAPAAAAAAPKPIKAPKPSAAFSPEVDAYLSVVALSMLAAGKAWAALAEGALATVDALATVNRRTCDAFSARAYAYLDLAHSRLERAAAAAASSSSSSSSAGASSSSSAAAGGAGSASTVGTDSLRPVLLAAHRSAALRHDDLGQAVLLVALLRGYVAQKEFTAAGKLIANATFPEAASAGQLVRYLYYKGRVQAVQLGYSDAYASLMQALRKAPTTRAAAPFRLAVQQAAICVQLLLGEIPERSIFSGTGIVGAEATAATPAVGAASATATAPAAAASAASSSSSVAREVAYAAGRLHPYYELTAAVRAGDVAGFSATLAKHSSTLAAEGNLTLAQRLEANVIRAGLRAIAASYSRIAFGHIAQRLGLSSPEDAEFLAAKAIRDGVVDAVLDHDAGAMVSVERTGVYGTREPTDAFHRRIAFCLDVYNEAVKGMRYAPSSRRKDLEDAEQRAAREAEEEELAKEIEEGEFDDEEDE